MLKPIRCVVMEFFLLTVRESAKRSRIRYKCNEKRGLYPMF